MGTRTRESTQKNEKNATIRGNYGGMSELKKHLRPSVQSRAKLQHEFGLFASDAINIECVRAIAVIIAINRIPAAPKMLQRLFCSDVYVALANHSRHTTRLFRCAAVCSTVFRR